MGQDAGFLLLGEKGGRLMELEGQKKKG